jgi:hypothetical protein
MFSPYDDVLGDIFLYCIHNFSLACVTAEELRREKPFLYLNISMVACQNAPRQREIVDAVQEYIAEQIW